MSYTVTETVVAAQATAVIGESTTWDAFPQLWPILLGEVWAVARASAEIEPNRNVMLYRDDVPNVEIGVEVADAVRCDRASRLVEPAGRSRRDDDASRRLRGDRAGTPAIIDWCDHHGLQRTGARWEIYGHATEHERGSGGRGLLPLALIGDPCTDPFDGAYFGSAQGGADRSDRRCRTGSRRERRRHGPSAHHHEPRRDRRDHEARALAHRHPRAAVHGSREAGRERRAIRDRRSGEDLVPQRLARERQVLAGARAGRAPRRAGATRRRRRQLRPEAASTLRPQPGSVYSVGTLFMGGGPTGPTVSATGPISDLSDSSVTVADLTCSSQFQRPDPFRSPGSGDNVTLTCTGGTLVRMTSVGTVTHSS